MKKLKRQVTGGWVDESLPDRAIDLIRAVPGTDNSLIDAIGRRLGLYRGFRQFYDTEPQVAVLVRHLEYLASKSHELMKDIQSLPSNAEAIATELMFTSWAESFPQFEQRLTQDLVRFSALMNAVAVRMKPLLGRRGERPNTLEHSLLSDVAQMLQNTGCGMKRIEEAQKAVEILVAAGVGDLPGTPEKARRVIIAWRKAQDRCE
ncbi:hypothetical protein D9M70_450120 [compost metagenome]